MTRTILAAVVIALAGCVTAPAVDPSFRLRPETRGECITHCETLGMRLGAVVLVRNSAGCVCEEIRSEPRAAGGGAAVTAGAYIVALEEEAARQQQQNTQHHSGAPTSPPPHVAPGHR